MASIPTRPAMFYEPTPAAGCLTLLPCRLYRPDGSVVSLMEGKESPQASTERRSVCFCLQHTPAADSQRGCADLCYPRASLRPVPAASATHHQL